MYAFTDIVSTTKKSIGKNTCQYIILHHTGWWSYKSNLRILSWDSGLVSVQFLVWENGECAKIGNPTDITRHAGDSQWGELKLMNRYAMGIEIVGPDKNGGFSDKQFERVVDLVRYLQTAFKIPRENILCHHDITWAWSKNKKLWDGKSMCRKPDLARTFWANRWIKSFDEFRKLSLI